MIVIMCGLPKSGKTTVVDQLFSDNDYIIRPADFVPENANQLSENLRKAMHLEAWKTGISLAREQIHEGTIDDVIVLDMCNREIEPLSTMIHFARKKGHKVVVLFVNAPTMACRSRDDSLDDKVFRTYVSSIKESLPKYKSECDQLLVVNNKNDLPDLISSLQEIRDTLCHNTSTPTPTT